MISRKSIHVTFLVLFLFAITGSTYAQKKGEWILMKGSIDLKELHPKVKKVRLTARITDGSYYHKSAMAAVLNADQPTICGSNLVVFPIPEGGNLARNVNFRVKLEEDVKIKMCCEINMWLGIENNPGEVEWIQPEHMSDTSIPNAAKPGTGLYCRSMQTYEIQ